MCHRDACAGDLPKFLHFVTINLMLLTDILSLLVAKEKRDPLALHLFHSAGLQLGYHIKALLPKTEPVQ